MLWIKMDPRTAFHLSPSQTWQLYMDKVLRGQGDGQGCKIAPYIEESPEGWNYDLARGETHKPIHYIALIIGNDKWGVV